MKVKSDHRSKFSNLSNWKEEAWKNQGFNGIRTRDLRDTGAMLYTYKYKRDFEQRLCHRDYPTALVHKILTEVQFSDRTETFRNKTKKAKEILPFVATNNPNTPNLKDSHETLAYHSTATYTCTCL